MTKSLGEAWELKQTAQKLWPSIPIEAEALEMGAAMSHDLVVSVIQAQEPSRAHCRGALNIEDLQTPQNDSQDFSTPNTARGCCWCSYDLTRDARTGVESTSEAGLVAAP